MSKLFIENTTLTAIGDSIRGKTGKTDLIAPGDMPAEIASITTGGGGLPEEAFVITGDCSYRFSHNGWNWFIDMYEDKITTQDIENGTSMFENSTLTKIPFDFNCKNNTYYSYDKMFYKCEKLSEIGTIRNMFPVSVSTIFQNCYCLRELPKFENFNSTRLESYNYANTSNMLNNCFSLRKIDFNLLKLFVNPVATSVSYSLYYNAFTYCYTLDEVKMPVVTAKYTSNVFNRTFDYCSRVKDVIFETNEDGSPIVANWKSQTIDLTKYLGYAQMKNHITGYNSGITSEEKCVRTPEQHEALKNDPDWFTYNESFSRYNHDSAVNTINSLPDVSASGGTNTIKFKGILGQLTDGGAINTLTEEEIAVAAAKGWTVTFV